MGSYLTHITTLSAILDIVIILVVVPWVLMTKKDATAAVAWCLVVLLIPLVGALLFWLFGYTHVSRPLKRVRTQRRVYRKRNPPLRQDAARGEAGPAEDPEGPPTWCDLGKLGARVQAFPVSPGNDVLLLHDTRDAYACLIEEVRRASLDIHLEFFILRSDPTTDALVAVLAHKARQGVQVRLLYDAIGCAPTSARTLAPLIDAGGRTVPFLPFNPLRARVQVNLRNHRKLVILDGKVGFTGGMNIGDEYLGKDPRFGYWRDSFLRLEGPAVAGLQRVFTEDWAFAHGEPLNGERYFPDVPPSGTSIVQVVESGPDQELKAIRELIFAAILSARERVWITTPYFVPDAAILDALRLACLRGVDVRLLTQLTGDHWLASQAARWYWAELLEAGMKIYQYRRGMLHAKVFSMDRRWGLVGSANLDNRSLHLSFEAGVVLHSEALVADLDEHFLQDLDDAARVEPAEFAGRPFRTRLAENAARLLSPLL